MQKLTFIKTFMILIPHLIHGILSFPHMYNHISIFVKTSMTEQNSETELQTNIKSCRVSELFIQNINVLF